MNKNLLQYSETEKFRPVSLTFYNKQVEKEFNDDYYVNSKVSLRFGVAFSFIFIFSQWFLNIVKFGPQAISVDFLFVLVIYLGLSVAYLSYKDWFTSYSQAATTIYGILIFYWCWAVFRQNQVLSEPLALLSFIPSVLFLMIIFYSFMRLRFVYNTAMLLTVSIIFVLILDRYQWISRDSINSATIAVYLFLINLFGMLLSHRLEYYSRRHFLLTKSLSAENLRSENLILNVLPESVADRLKDSDDTIVDEFAQVSILFCDICGFTPLSSKMPAKNVVAMLNDMFTGFDEIADKYQVEKIKTMGDCYMAVAGLPVVTEDHAIKIAKMALEMRNFVHSFSEDLDVRIGINTGPVVAGVIGTKKFIYDLWGDSVNVAARMESHSEKGQIQITEETYNLIREEFECEYRGVINVKGKGDMNTYFLNTEKELVEVEVILPTNIELTPQVVLS
jgi:class 3 adenylate cyclase